MRYISQNEKTFLLNTRKTSYMLMANEHGHIEQLHYGSRVEPSDAGALRYKRTAPYGSEVMYTPEDDTYCLDNLPLNWSGIGKGDFRIPPAELVMPDGSFTCDFIYERHEILPGILPAESLPCAYADKEDEAETLTLHLREKVYDIRLRLIYTVFHDTDTITRRAELENRENAPLQLRRMMSALIDLPNKNFKMISFDGDWIKEAKRSDRKLMPGCFVNESSTGSSSNRHNPGVLLAAENACEDYGEVYGFNLVYSGNHYTAAELCPRGMVRVISGINPLCFSWTLENGELFETPEAVMTYSASGFNGMSRNFHDFINRHIISGEWKGKERPILFNNWEAHFFKFTRRSILRLARRAKDLGAELFVLDDGWFGERNSDRAGLGDYNVNLKKLPGGVEALSGKITSMGLLFGLWFEPECVNEDSELYRSHPEYAVRLPNRAPSLGRNQLVLDLSKPEVRDYIVKSVGNVLDSADISYVKWDMNRHMSDMFSTSCPTGEFFHRYILGLYEVLERIFRSRPHILLESCSSGGNRFDLGMLRYSPQIWASDNTDPIERLRIQKGLSYLYPQSAVGAHVSQAPHMQTLRYSPLSTRFNVACFGAFGYELDPGELSYTEKKQLRAQIAFYKKYRKTLQFGDFYRYDVLPQNREVFLAAEKDGSRAVLSLVQTQAEAAQENDVLRAKGLCPDKRYRLSAVPQKLAVSRFGGLLKHVFPVALRADGFILRTVNRLYSLADGSFELCATGAALSGGVSLNNQFTGAGYRKDLRLWGDFGSTLYTILPDEASSGLKET